MARCVSLLVLVHGVLAFQTKGMLSLSDESSDSSPGPRKSYYILRLLPIQRLKGTPENAFDRKAADLLAMRTSSVFGAPDMIRPTVNTVPVASFQLPPVRVISRQSPSALTPPPGWGSPALRGPVLTLSTQSQTRESNGATTMPGNLGTYCGTSARFPLIPQVLTTPGFPTKGPLHSASFPTSPTTKEPRGDV